MNLNLTSMSPPGKEQGPGVGFKLFSPQFDRANNALLSPTGSPRHATFKLSPAMRRSQNLLHSNRKIKVNASIRLQKAPLDDGTEVKHVTTQYLLDQYGEPTPEYQSLSQ